MGNEIEDVQHDQISIFSDIGHYGSLAFAAEPKSQKQGEMVMFAQSTVRRQSFSRAKGRTRKLGRDLVPAIVPKAPEACQ